VKTNTQNLTPFDSASQRFYYKDEDSSSVHSGISVNISEVDERISPIDYIN
jgi:hypothetical protein